MSANLFDIEIKALTEQSLEILNKRYSGVSGALGQGKDEIMYLTRYQDLYKALKPKDFHDDFKLLFKRKKAQILNTLNDDSWLRKGNVVIQFCESMEELSIKCKKIKIPLSHIYQCAIHLQDSAQQALDELSPELQETNQNKDIIRPSIILLHLFRIFYALEEDKTELTDIITTLETDLRVKNRVITSTNASVNPSSTPADGLSTLFNMVTGALRQGGMAVPEDMHAPTTDEFSKVINAFIDNDGVRNLFQSFGQIMNNQNTADNGSAVMSALSGLLRPEALQNLQNTVLQTAEIARETATQPTQPRED